MSRLSPETLLEFNFTVGGLLQDLRKSKHLTRKNVAKALKPLNVKQIRKIERGRCSIPAPVFIDMINYYQANWFYVEQVIFDAFAKLKATPPHEAPRFHVKSHQ